MSLPFAWCMLIAVGFSFVFWGLDVGSFSDAWVTSGSSLFTLGFAKPEGGGLIWLTFVEATIGLGVVALLISFLPTLYAAYSAREQGVGMLAPLAGSPASATQLLWRLHAAHSLVGSATWSSTSAWFVAVEQSHIAFPALSQFPPQQEERSWVTTAGTVLDAAAIALSVAEIEKRRPVDAAADAGGEGTQLGGLLLLLAHGSSAIVGTARAAGIAVEDPPTLVDLVLGTDHDPSRISVERREYDEALEFLAEAGVVGAVDAERGWVTFSRIRASYDTALRGLAGLTHAPPRPGRRTGLSSLVGPGSSATNPSTPRALTGPGSGSGWPPRRPGPARSRTSDLSVMPARARPRRRVRPHAGTVGRGADHR